MAEGLSRQLHQGGHRQGDALQGGSGDVAAVAVPREPHQHTAGLGVPVGGPPTGEGGHQHHPAAVRHRLRQGIHLIGLLDDLQAVPQPLHHSSCIEQAALQAVGGCAAGIGPAKGAE